MQYTPDEVENFAGQTGYGYISFEKFVDAVTVLKEGTVTLEELDQRGLPSLANTVITTAILQGGRKSLEEFGRGWKRSGDSREGKGTVDVAVRGGLK